MAHQLPALPYGFDALEPFIDEATMRIHHGKHHQAYIDNLNKAVTGTALENVPAEQLLRDLSAVPEGIRNVVRNHGGGHANHSLFWQIMAPGRRRRSDRRGRRGDQRRRSAASSRSRRSSPPPRWASSAPAGAGWSSGRTAPLRSSTPPTRTAPVGRRHADPRRRRLGARLLPEVPEPPRRVPPELVLRGQLVQGERPPSPGPRLTPSGRREIVEASRRVTGRQRVDSPASDAAESRPAAPA